MVAAGTTGRLANLAGGNARGQADRQPRGEHDRDEPEFEDRGRDPDDVPGRRADELVGLAVVVVLAWSFALGSWLVLAAPSSATSEQVELVDAINGIVRVSIAIAIVITAVSGALEVRRFVQLRSN